MLSLCKGRQPTPTNTIRQSRTIGRRVSPNTSRPLSTMISLSDLSEASSKLFCRVVHLLAIASALLRNSAPSVATTSPGCNPSRI